MEVPSEAQQELLETQATARPVAMAVTAVLPPVEVMAVAQAQAATVARELLAEPSVRSREVLPDADRMVVQAVRPERQVMLVPRLLEALAPMAVLVPMAVRVEPAAQVALQTEPAPQVARVAMAVMAARAAVAEGVVPLGSRVEPAALVARAVTAALVVHSAQREPQQAAPSARQETLVQRARAAMVAPVARALTMWWAPVVTVALAVWPARVAMAAAVERVALA